MKKFGVVIYILDLLFNTEYYDDLKIFDTALDAEWYAYNRMEDLKRYYFDLFQGDIDYINLNYDFRVKYIDII